MILRINATLNTSISREYAELLKKEAAFLESQKKEEEEILKSFGLGITSDGKITGI